MQLPTCENHKIRLENCPPSANCNNIAMYHICGVKLCPACNATWSYMMKHIKMTDEAGNVTEFDAVVKEKR